jgi:hypothetical protein
MRLSTTDIGEQIALRQSSLTARRQASRARRFEGSAAEDSSGRCSTTDKTYLPESVLAGGGELAFSLSSKPNKSWWTAASSAPPSFGAGSLAVTMNVSPAVVAVDAGTNTDVTVNVQRMVDGPSGYVISGKSYEAGISVASAKGGSSATTGPARRR